MRSCFYILLLLLLAIMPMSAQYRDVKLPEKPKQTKYTNYEREDKGFWFAIETEGGSSVMVHRKNMQYVNISFTGGYRLSEYFRFGVGFGGRMYVNNANVRDADNKFGIPIFANVRGNFISAYERDGVPCWSFNIGGITNDGFFVSPTIGYSFGGLRNNFLIGVNYTMTAFRNSDKNNVIYSYFGLKLGYEF